MFSDFICKMDNSIGIEHNWLTIEEADKLVKLAPFLDKLDYSTCVEVLFDDYVVFPNFSTNDSEEKLNTFGTMID